ncbi:MAG: hypothetical protein SFH39_06190 [Candidatus Magnetobacterium sp. LHC-1]
MPDKCVDDLVTSEDKQKRIDLARQLAQSTGAEKKSIRQRLINVYSQVLRDADVRAEIELTILKLDGSLSTKENGFYSTTKVALNQLYSDIVEENPVDKALIEILDRYATWNPTTGLDKFIWSFLTPFKAVELREKAIKVLTKNNQIDSRCFDYLNECIKNNVYMLGRFHIDIFIAHIDKYSNEHDKIKIIEKTILSYWQYSDRDDSVSSESMIKILDWISDFNDIDIAVNMMEKLLHHDNSYVREDFPERLVKLGYRGIYLIKKILRTDTSSQVTGKAAKVLLNKGMNVDDILSEALHNNDDSLYGVCRAINNSKQLLNINPRVREVLRKIKCEELFNHLEHTIHEYYFRYRDARYYLKHLRHMFMDITHVIGGTLWNSGLCKSIPHIKLIKNKIRNTLYMIEENEPNTTQIKSLFAGLLSYDDYIGRAMGLYLKEPLKIEYSDILPIEYLVEYVEPHKMDSMENLIQEFGQNHSVQESIKMEHEVKGFRDKLAEMRHDYQSIIEKDSWEKNPKLEQLLNEISILENYFYGSIHERDERLEEREGYRSIRFIRSLSAKISGVLEKYPVHFTRVDSEGLLGEFIPLDSTAIIYSKMIDITAKSELFYGMSYDREDISDYLHIIAEVHELIHGYIIHAYNADNNMWKNYGKAPYWIHEAMASLWTKSVISSMRENDILDVYNRLERKFQPICRMDNISGEPLRNYLNQWRNGSDLPNIIKWTILILERLILAIPLINEKIGNQRCRQMIEKIMWVLERLDVNSIEIEKAVKLCCKFIKDIVRIVPEITYMSDLLLDRAWPTDKEIAMASLTVLGYGKPIGENCALRIDLNLLKQKLNLSEIIGTNDIKPIYFSGIPMLKTMLEQLNLKEGDDPFSLLSDDGGF